MTNTDKQIDTVAGIELPAIARNYTFGILDCANGTEVLLLRNGKPRRMALCTHRNDAEVILNGLNKLKQMGLL